MKIDFDAALLNAAGTDLIDGESGEPIRLLTVAIGALTRPTKTDQNSSLDQKVKVFRLAQQVAPGGVHDLSPEDVALLRQRINEAFPSPAIVGAAADLLS